MVEEWIDIPMIATSVSRPSVAVTLVMDESGSMLYDAGNNRSRLEVLKLAAHTFIDQLYDDNGIAMVSFDENSATLLNLDTAGPLTSVVRADARAEINSHGPPDIYQHTSIGAGLQEASDLYATSPNSSNFDTRSIIVFTDGFEDRAPLIADVQSTLINDNVYAIGLGDAGNVRNDILRELVDNSGGYMLVTGAISTDDEFLLEKYFIQVLVGVINRNIVRDPQGYLVRGEVTRVPFTICRSDIAFDAISLTHVHQSYIAVGLQTPDGSIILQHQVPANSFRQGTSSTSYRITLPLVVDGNEHWEGEWQLLISPRWKPTSTTLAAGIPFSQSATIPYNAVIHARSNLNLRANVSQSGNAPGSTLTINSLITEYGELIETHPQISAIITYPNQTEQKIFMDEIVPGTFELKIMGEPKRHL